MRLFVALDLPDSILQTLDLLIAELQPAAPRLQWSVCSNLHITTKFIGEFAEARVPELSSALGKLPPSGPLAISVQGLGWFPAAVSAKVFWAGVDGGKPLENLARETDQAVARLGVPPEKRAFRPHLTLARIKAKEDLAPLRQAIGQLDSLQFGNFQARSQFLYLSRNSVYTKLQELPL